MNHIFFLIPLLFIPSLVFAESYQNYDIIDNGDGTKTLTTHEPYVFDGNSWTPFIASGNTITTDLATVTLDNDGIFTWNGKFSDSIKAKYADISDLTSWTYINSINNDTPNVSWDGTQLVSEKQSAAGNLKYKYVLNKGEWKTLLEAKNLSGLTTKVFGFDQIIDLNSDTIKFGGVTRNLDNFDGVTFDKEFLDNNQGKLLDLLNGVNFDFDLGYENLYSITVHDTGANSSQLVFDYRTSTVLLPGETLIIDPTFGFSSGTVKRPASNNPSSGTCVGRTYVTADANDDINYGSSSYCSIPTLEYDVTAVPDTVVSIDSGRVKYDLDSDSLTGDCVLRELDHVPANNQTTYNESLSGTKITAAFNGCSVTVGNNKIIDINAAGLSDILSKISGGQNWYAFSFYMDTVTAPSGGFNTMSDIQLQFNYTESTAPDAVDDLTYANLDNNSVDLLWTQPDLNGESLINYLINYTSPHGTPSTFLANTTNTYYNVTGLLFGTEYSYRVSALTAGGYNATGNILNITTTSTTYSTAPVLTASAESATQIDLDWTATSMTNVNGYRIQRETPSGSGWSTIVTNTTNTNLYYNNTGLSTNIIYNYRVYAMNGSGISQASNEYEMTTFHLPDAVDDLTGTATSFSTVSLTWGVPTSYAPSITGYRVNYTTPEGNPTLIITPDPYASTNSAIIYNLSVGGEYSFRVAPITVHGTNTTGNIFNVTTSNPYTLGNLTSGQTTNTDDFKIFFDRTDVNSTHTNLDVTFPNVYDLECNFSYQLARTNNTYGNLTTVPDGADDQTATFVFINATGDIINVKCYDIITDDEARYVLTITDFPFLDLISNMRDGTYGTYFQIGAIDGVTLMICVLAMIGFNRTNPIAGIIFLVVTVGVLSFFEIITYPLVMYPALALLMVWGFISTRKDD